MKLTERNGKIGLREICFEDVAARYNTPFYLYDLKVVNDKIADIRRVFDDSLELYYAMKANPNRELLGAIRDKVDGLDIASGGELELALKAGYAPSTISFAGPGKTHSELQRSLKAGIGFISVESRRELREIEKLVEEEGISPASILIRVNPKLFIKEFAVKMGGKPSPFGIDEEDLPSTLEFVRSKPEAFSFKGIHIYAGTQCLSEDHLVQNSANILSIATRVTTEFGLECQVINIGGGFGVSYSDPYNGLDLGKMADMMNAEFEQYRQTTGTKPRFILELGRFLVAEAGIYVARIVSEKKSRGEHFYVLDGGMNHHLAASGNLGATIRKNFQVRNLSRANLSKENCTLVGPLCTPMDLMGKGVSIEAPAIGDLIGFLCSGSYGYSASPLLFLGHDLPSELILSSEGYIME